MNYQVEALSVFAKQLKRLAKKYVSVKRDVSLLIESLAKNPTQGVPLGGGVYKIRLAIASKGKGKSGGARIITYVLFQNKEIWLMAMYDKSELENLAESDYKRLVEIVLAEVASRKR